MRTLAFATTVCSVGLLLSTPATHAIEGPPQGEPPIHRSAQLSIILDGPLLLISFETPASDLLGSDDASHSEANQASYREALATLNSPQSILGLPERAACNLESVDVRARELDSEAAGSAAEHTQFNATYRYFCRAPLALRELHVELFRRWPGLQAVDVSLLLPNGEGTQVLTPRSNRVLLRE